MTATHSKLLRHRYKDLTGKVFGRLTVVSHEGSNERGRGLWNCRCRCGHTKIILGCSLTSGNTRSCGCLHKEIVAELGRRHAKYNGLCYSPEYLTWRNMIYRCTKPTMAGYHHYGGRGIRVCQRWRNSFLTFYQDMGQRPSPKHSIDRIDTNGNYTPKNCRWATIHEQMRNRRNNKNLTHNGRTMTIAEWAREVGVAYSTIPNRLQRGWSVEKAVTTPKING